jgi:hypothetical protein
MSRPVALLGLIEPIYIGPKALSFISTKQEAIFTSKRKPHKREFELPLRRVEDGPLGV